MLRLLFVERKTGGFDSGLSARQCTSHLLNIMLDEDYGDITDPTDGRDVKVTCTKAPGRQWATD